MISGQLCIAVIVEHVAQIRGVIRHVRQIATGRKRLLLHRVILVASTAAVAAATAVATERRGYRLGCLRRCLHRLSALAISNAVLT